MSSFLVLFGVLTAIFLAVAAARADPSAAAHPEPVPPPMVRIGLDLVPRRRVRRRAVDLGPAASLSLAAGASVEYLREQLGDADLRTTHRYLAVLELESSSVMERVEAVLAGGVIARSIARPGNEVDLRWSRALTWGFVVPGRS